MYKINKSSNSITKLVKKTFSELGFKERQHLQEWIAKEPTCLGEELLIIQKEFDGFDDTKERLDLLALDKDGALVIIENKLDDTGRDVIWQAIKYASYCSNLTKSQIVKIYQDYLDKYEDGIDAKEKLTEFFDDMDYDEILLNRADQDQRIIFIAANFRKEITSAALWLLNHNISIQCYKTTPYLFGEELLLSIDQIIPTKEAEEYMIGMAEKEQEQKTSEKTLKNRHNIRFEFWKKILDAMSSTDSHLFSNISPSKEHWLSAGSGMRACPFTFVFSKKFGRIEFYINRESKEENEMIFNKFIENKTAIEDKFGSELVWEKMEDKKACRIKFEKSFDGYNRENWDSMIKFMTTSMVSFEKVMKPFIDKVNSSLRG